MAGKHTHDGHCHGHSHSHAPSHGRAFAISVALNSTFVVVEVVYGLLAGSMALVADAAHNLSDVLGLLLAWGATRLAMIEPSEGRTYGWRKSTILAALLNALLIVLAVGGVAWEAVARLQHPTAVDGLTVIIVAGIGVAINGASAALFFAGRKNDANIRGAFLHLAADAAISVGVVLAGIVVLWTEWLWIDPITSLVISAIIVVATWGLLRESVDMLMDAVPSHIDLAKVRECLSADRDIADVHDLHVWAASTNENCLTAHLGVHADADAAMLLKRLEGQLRERFAINHTTIQLEPESLAGECTQGRSGAL